jgi:hypothetical protein
MKKHQNASGIAARNDGPLPRYPAKLDWSDLHVLGDGPNRADLVEALSPLGPTDRPGFCRQQRADGLNFALRHQVIAPAAAYGSLALGLLLYQFRIDDRSTSWPGRGITSQTLRALVSVAAFQVAYRKRKQSQNLIDLLRDSCEKAQSELHFASPGGRRAGLLHARSPQRMAHLRERMRPTVEEGRGNDCIVCRQQW